MLATNGAGETLCFHLSTSLPELLQNDLSVAARARSVTTVTTINFIITSAPNRNTVLNFINLKMAIFWELKKIDRRDIGADD
jgi:hypothetical protein